MNHRFLACKRGSLLLASSQSNDLGSFLNSQHAGAQSRGIPLGTFTRLPSYCLCLHKGTPQHQRGRGVAVYGSFSALVGGGGSCPLFARTMQPHSE